MPVVLLITAVIATLAITGLLVSISFGNEAFNARLNSQAYAAASAGAQDGTLRVIRNCPIGSISGTSCNQSGGTSFTCPDLTTGYISGSYAITIGSVTATVIVRDDPECTWNKIVISTATIFAHTKRIQVRLTSDQSTGATNVKSSWECYTYDNSNYTVPNTCLVSS